MGDGERERAHAAFETLANETRLGILRALAERLRTHPDDPTLNFSDLRRSVGRRDSGNFNYHLQQMLGRFVVETDAGYRISATGMEVVAAIIAGTYGKHERRGPHDIDERCPVCDESLAATYEDGLLEITCGNDHSFRNTFPPGAIDGRDLGSVVRLMTLRTQQDMELALQDVCPNCYGRLRWSLEPEWERQPPQFDTRCERCGANVEIPAGTVLLRHPAVVSFYYDHGVNVRERPYWSPTFWRDVRATVTDDDPLRVAITVELDGERLRLTVDRELSLLDVERGPTAE